MRYTQKLSLCLNLQSVNDVEFSKHGRHSGESRNPAPDANYRSWIPAFAGMTQLLCGVLSFIFLLTMVGGAAAGLDFPALTGRVVDEAGVMSEGAKANLERRLANYESQSGNQIVVATLKSLRGTAIEDYGYQLGRAWGVGQKGKNNGVLLIVAPNEKQVRIEVGYGLEGTLTDAMSSRIINETIIPAIRDKGVERGVFVGVNAIISTLGGGDALPHNPASMHNNQAPPTWLVIVVLVVALILFIRFPDLFFILLAITSMGGRGGGSGGFSGGGGSFGGGGASGRW